MIISQLRVNLAKKKKRDYSYRIEPKTYLQGTIRRLYEYHLYHSGVKKAEYLRGLIREDLTKRYEVNHTGGVVKIRK